MKELNVELNIGYEVDGTYTRDVELMRTDLVAEKVYTKKSADKPYTYIANVVSVACKSIGDTLVAGKVRDDYMASKSVSIPRVVKDMPLSDANSLLLEIHRRVWKSIIPEQTVLCKFCAKSIVMDIDLDKVVMDEKFATEIAQKPEYKSIICDLSDGFDLDHIVSKRDELKHLQGVQFNQLIFRIPTLGDAIKNEAYVGDTLLFWRRIAVDCLMQIRRVDESGTVVADFPEEKLIWVGLSLFDKMFIEDLQKIRHSLREELPTMPFAYEEECPCDMQRKIPCAMEASGFFSE